MFIPTQIGRIRCVRLPTAAFAEPLARLGRDLDFSLTS